MRSFLDKSKRLRVTSRSGIFLLFLLFSAFPITVFSASIADSLTISGDSITELNEVTVVEGYRLRQNRSTTPLQIINEDKIEALNSIQLSDAVKHMNGVVVKD